MRKWLVLTAILGVVVFFASAKPLVLNYTEAVNQEGTSTIKQKNIETKKQKNITTSRVVREQSLAPKFVGKSKDLDFPLTARAAIAADSRTGEILFARQAQEKMPIASLTKLATALVMLDKKLNFNDEVEIAQSDVRGGVPEYLLIGEKVTVGDLWNLMLVSSYNTAAAALVRHLGQGEADFLRFMREKANDLFLFEVEFADATGLSPENKGSARNIARLARIAFARSEIVQSSGAPEYEFVTRNTQRNVRVNSTNLLLGSYKNGSNFNVISGKTGYLDESRYNLVINARRGDNNIVVVILGSESKDTRFEEALSLAKWAFLNYQWPDNH